MSGFQEQPDHSQQRYERNAPLVSPIFADVNKQIDFSKQGDEASYTPVDTEPRGRVSRSDAGSTGYRSSSISRERNSQINQAHSSNAADQGAPPTRQLSPNRAMGARSVSIQGRLSEGYTVNRGTDTVEGIGSSVDQNPIDGLPEENDERGRRGGQEGAQQRVVSPSRAMGARSVSRN